MDLKTAPNNCCHNSFRKQMHANPQDFPDQYQYLGNCPPTPPLTQQQSIDNNVGLGEG